MKKILSIYFILFFGLSKIVASSFVVGTASGYAPYVSLNSQGEYEGFDIDVAKLLAEKLNRKLVLKDLGSMPSLMMGLNQGKVDALIWAISITESRMKTLEMVYYQGEKETEMPFLFWNTIPSDITTIESLEGKSKKMVCVEAGTWQEDVLKKFPKVSLKFIDKIIDGILEIKYGKSLTVAVDPSLISLLAKQYPEIKVLNLPLPKSEQSFGHGICLSKKNKDLAREVKEAIESLRSEGKIKELERKWNLVKGGI